MRSMTDAKGLHGLSCKGSTDRSARQHNLNDLVWLQLATTNQLTKFEFEVSISADFEDVKGDSA